MRWKPVLSEKKHLGLDKFCHAWVLDGQFPSAENVLCSPQHNLNHERSSTNFPPLIVQIKAALPNACRKSFQSPGLDDLDASLNDLYMICMLPQEENSLRDVYFNSKPTRNCRNFQHVVMDTGLHLIVSAIAPVPWRHQMRPHSIGPHMAKIG